MNELKICPACQEAIFDNRIGMSENPVLCIFKREEKKKVINELGDCASYNQKDNLYHYKCYEKVFGSNSNIKN